MYLTAYFLMTLSLIQLKLTLEVMGWVGAGAEVKAGVKKQVKASGLQEPRTVLRPSFFPQPVAV